MLPADVIVCSLDPSGVVTTIWKPPLARVV